MNSKNNGENKNFFNNCAVCGKSCHSKEEIFVTGDEKRSLFHATCGRCFSSSLFLVFDNEERGMVNIGLLTDLERSEVMEKVFEDPISADEVIDAHEMISNFKGDALQV